LLLESGTLHDFLDRLAQLTVQALPEGSSCGVTVRQNSRAVTVAASDELALRIDQLQYDFGEGPCLETLATGELHYIVDTASEARWPRFCSAAHEQGVRSCLGLPLNGPTGLMGGYNMYSMWRDAFAEDNREELEMFAANASGAIAVAMKLADQAQMSDDLHTALARARSLIKPRGSSWPSSDAAPRPLSTSFGGPHKTAMSRSVIWPLRLSTTSAVSHQSRALSTPAAPDPVLLVGRDGCGGASSVGIGRRGRRLDPSEGYSATHAL
jgi:hypothetical protein